MKQPELIYGKRAVEEAVLSGKTIEKLLIEKGHPDQRHWVQLAQKQHFPYQLLPPAAFDRLLRGRRHQGLALYFAPVDYVPLPELVNRLYEEGANPCLLMLDGITDVGNFGAICRSAEALGAHGLILQTYNSVRIGGDAMQASAGALSHLPLTRVADLNRTVENLQLFGLRVVGLTEQASFPLEHFDLTSPTCLVMGAEGHGLSEGVREKLDHEAQIPLAGRIGSLNVSVAAGIALYELIRQRA